MSRAWAKCLLVAGCLRCTRQAQIDGYEPSNVRANVSFAEAMMDLC
jgi:hypothetical protein